MKNLLKVYLDNCVFNRPFDYQEKLSVRLETEAKLYIQQKIKDKEIQLIWSYILDYENSFNPYEERKEAISLWKNHASIDIEESNELLHYAEEILKIGIKSKDALHIASAFTAKADYFITTDKELIKKTTKLGNLSCINPVNFIEILEDLNHERHRT
jgi:predicted nucleic acid-binding protein